MKGKLSIRTAAEIEQRNSIEQLRTALVESERQLRELRAELDREIDAKHDYRSRALAAEKDAERWRALFPEATSDQKADGWTLLYSWLEKIKDIARRDDYSGVVSMEDVETVLLAARQAIDAARDSKEGVR